MPNIFASAIFFLVVLIGVTGLKTRGFGGRIPGDIFSSPACGLVNPVMLKVVTFNIQDIPLISIRRSERMTAIAKELGELDPDIVGFQESFVWKDRQTLVKKLKEYSRLQHHQYYPSGVFGSGLLISSVFPIVKISFQQFSVSNPFYKFYEGDWWAGKGVALARLELPEGSGFIDVYNTHTQAGYGNRTYNSLRKQQMEELAEFVIKSSKDTTPALILGDINCRIGSEDCAAAVYGADLLHLMSIESGLDHIFAAGHYNYWFELLETKKIEERIKIRGRNLTLSDHSGFMSSIYISQAASTLFRDNIPLHAQFQEGIGLHTEYQDSTAVQ